MKKFEVNENKALIFDLGNVVYNTYIPLIIQNIADEYHMQYQECEDIFTFIQPMQDLGYHDIFSAVKPFIKNADKEFIKKSWLDVIEPNPYIIEMMQNTTGNLFVLSNIGIDHADIIKKQLPEHWHLFLSCEIGARKPSKLLYNYVMDEVMAISGKRVTTVFVDDRRDNLDAAEPFFDYTLQFNLENYYDDESAAEQLQQLVNKACD